MAHCGVRSDEELIAACRAADQGAWTEVYDRYHRLVRSIARSYGANGHDTDEIVQISFSVLFDSIDRIRPDSNLAAWLSTIARRHTWRLIEKRRRTDLRDGLPEDPLLVTPIDDHVDRDGHETLVRAALRLLPSKSRTLIELLYLRGDEPSYQDVAAELDMPIGSIGPTRARCLEKLRSIMDELESERTGGTGR
jgi:RNA polymerase sigma factor (sigma-70 family)